MRSVTVLMGLFSDFYKRTLTVHTIISGYQTGSVKFFCCFHSQHCVKTNKAFMFLTITFSESYSRIVLSDGNVWMFRDAWRVLGLRLPDTEGNCK